MGRAYDKGQVSLRAVWDCYLGWEAHAAHGDTCALRAALLDPVVIHPMREFVA